MTAPGSAPAADSLDALFSPRSIAVIGASATPSKIGGTPIAYLKSFGYSGRIVPINPKAEQIQGLPAFPDLRSAGGAIDLAVFAVPQAAVDAALDDAIGAGVKAAIVFSSGFAEIGAEGMAAQDRLAAKARAAGVRIIGPNCLGVMNLREQGSPRFQCNK